MSPLIFLVAQSPQNVSIIKNDKTLINKIVKLASRIISSLFLNTSLIIMMINNIDKNKVIKLFRTQAEALDYAKALAANKSDGSSVRLHGLDGKIRKA